MCAFLLSANFFKISFFQNILSGLPSECQTDQAECFLWPDLGPNRLKGAPGDQV